MRTADLTTALILMAGGLLVIWDSLRLGHRLGHRRPAERVLPVLARGVPPRVLRDHRRAGVAPDERRALRHPRAARAGAHHAAALRRAFVVLIQFLGLYVAAALFIGLYMRWIGRYGWVPVIARCASRSRCSPSWSSRSGSWCPCPRARSRPGSGTEHGLARTCSSVSRSRSSRTTSPSRCSASRSAPSSACCPAWAAPTASRSCCRSRSR